MTDRIPFRTAVTIYRRVHGMAPDYLSELCSVTLLIVSTLSQIRQQKPACRPPVRLSTYGGRCLSVSGPTIWNSLPDYLTLLYLWTFFGAI